MNEKLQWIGRVKARGVGGWYYLHRVSRRDRMTYAIEWHVYYITRPKPPNELVGVGRTPGQARRKAEDHHQRLIRVVDSQSVPMPKFGR